MGWRWFFYTSPEAPAQCAIEISRALNEHPHLQLRMGVHSDPVSGVIDVTGHANLAGAGLNMANRVMSCGDAGHILVSKRIAEDLGEYEHWRPFLHDLGAGGERFDYRVTPTSYFRSKGRQSLSTAVSGTVVLDIVECQRAILLTGSRRFREQET